jgi:hypothetical protein
MPSSGGPSPLGGQRVRPPRLRSALRLGISVKRQGCHVRGSVAAHWLGRRPLMREH